MNLEIICSFIYWRFSGKYYIKIGHGAEFDRTIASKDVAGWYKTEVPETVKSRLVSTLKDFVPGSEDVSEWNKSVACTNPAQVCVASAGFEPASIHTGTCVTTRTKNRCVFVDLLSPQMGVALAGNGFAAKACDHIGKMAADLLVTSSWNSDLPRDLFKFRSKPVAGTGKAKL